MKIRKVTENLVFTGEQNDLGSQTITTGYIPINEQVAMIMRGEITVGVSGFDDATDDINSVVPEEYFEDATDYDTESELCELYEAETSQRSRANTAEQQKNVSDASSDVDTNVANEVPQESSTSD